MRLSICGLLMRMATRPPRPSRPELGEDPPFRRWPTWWRRARCAAGRWRRRRRFDLHDKVDGANVDAEFEAAGGQQGGQGCGTSTRLRSPAAVPRHRAWCDRTRSVPPARQARRQAFGEAAGVHEISLIGACGSVERTGWIGARSSGAPRDHLPPARRGFPMPVIHRTPEFNHVLYRHDDWSSRGLRTTASTTGPGGPPSVGA